jgi:uncharacterized RDD family membrane protein YckC
MQDALRFETPENVQVRYQPAGLGTRFVAWFVDQMILWVCMFVVFVALIAAGISFDFISRMIGPERTHDDHAILYFAGLMMLIWGLGSIAYFGCCELLFRGQTVGKRTSNIRVIKSNGFQLDAASILVRNIFRVIDNMPPMWLFPIISRIGQRAGDMVAGTLVVFDQPTSFSSVRGDLAARSPADARFRFDASLLKRLSGNDYVAVERVLERIRTLLSDDRANLLEVYAIRISQKLMIDPPPTDQRQRFLEDLFAAELRRQDRNLG